MKTVKMLIILLGSTLLSPLLTASGSGSNEPDINIVLRTAEEILLEKSKQNNTSAHMTNLSNSENTINKEAKSLETNKTSNDK